MIILQEILQLLKTGNDIFFSKEYEIRTNKYQFRNGSLLINFIGFAESIETS